MKAKEGEKKVIYTDRSVHMNSCTFLVRVFRFRNLQIILEKPFHNPQDPFSHTPAQQRVIT